MRRYFLIVFLSFLFSCEDIITPDLPVNEPIVVVDAWINNLEKDQVIKLNNRLVIGLFHKAKSCDKSEIVKIDNHQVTGLFCEFRNNTPDEELQSGMGDIFIKLAR